MTERRDIELLEAEITERHRAVANDWREATRGFVEANGPAPLADLRIHGELTDVGWIPPYDNMTYEEWVETGDTLTRINIATKFARGDWLAYGEGRGRWGEMYAQAMDQTRMSYQTLVIEKYVSTRVPIIARAQELSWSHHREVAPLEPDEQRAWLEAAKREGMSRETLRDAIRGDVTQLAPSPFDAWMDSLRRLSGLITSIEYSGMETVAESWDNEQRGQYVDELRRIEGTLEGYATLLEGDGNTDEHVEVETEERMEMCPTCEGSARIWVHQPIRG